MILELYELYQMFNWKDTLSLIYFTAAFIGSQHFYNFFPLFIDEFLYSAQLMSQITPLEVEILFLLCNLIHPRGG